MALAPEQAILGAAEALVKHGEDTNAAVLAYEEAMFARSEKSARESAANLELFFGPQSPQVHP